MEETEEALRQSKNRKATGTGKINMELLKYGSCKLKIRLLQLFNDMWNERKIREEWNIVKIINIHKKGHKNRCENYRGISLLSTACKLYTTILKTTKI
jgi:hypothetical protein